MSTALPLPPGDAVELPAGDTRSLNDELLLKTQLLQTTLNSINQGIFMIDAQDRITTYNPRVCELLDLPEELLRNRATVRDLTHYQMQRGDFGPDGQRVDSNAREYVMAGGQFAQAPSIPMHYLRETPAGRTLEVSTRALPEGGMVRTFTDVTDYVQAESARQHLNELLDVTQSMARVGGMDFDVVNDVVAWTLGTYRIYETTPEEFTPSNAASIARFISPQALATIEDLYGDPTRQVSSHDLELEMITAKGRRIWVHSIGTATWVQGRLIKRTSVVQDIDDRKRAEALKHESEQRWKLALESVGDGVWDWNLQTGQEFFSKSLLAMYGYGENELASNALEFDQRTHPDDVEQLQLDRQAHLNGLTPTYTNEHRVRCKDGSWKWVLTRGMLISRTPEGKPLRMIGTHTDISERKKSEEMIWQQAHFDPLTSLPNRRLLRDRLAQEIRKCKREDLKFALLFIDLDHFKEVNDTLGHGHGDLLLVEAARRLRACVRDCDTVARMGGDEFTVILTPLTEVHHLDRLLAKLLGAMAQVFHLEDEKVFVSASIGVTLYPLDGADVEVLFKNADQALYVAKGSGRNRFSYFTQGLHEAAQNRVRLASDLRDALAKGQFSLAFQPIVDMASGAVYKAEALIRWNHPIRGMVSPGTFIPVAEANGLIVDIGEWVFLQAVQQVKAWRQTLDPNFQISINKSPVQFHASNGAYTSWVEQLVSLGLPGECLAVEITEGLLLATSDHVAVQLKELANAGIGVSLDDFGTGYSSLSYLQKFDIDFVKIDQSFVRHLAPNTTELALCKAIILMAHELGLKVIAEGVETALQRDLLKAAGCDYGQGYLFARPMPASVFELYFEGLVPSNWVG